MGKARNNEYSCLEYLEECVPPNVYFNTFGGNTANVPDIIALDNADPFKHEKVLKAHYVIIGDKLYLHTPGIDPWNIEEVYDNLNLSFQPLQDKKVQISKRPAGAKRISGSKGGEPLQEGDSRYVSFGIRFWVDVPKHGIDLTNSEHQNALNWTLGKIRHFNRYIPYATFDAKMDERTQFVGPSITINRNNDNLSLVFDEEVFVGSLNKTLENALLDDKMRVKINEYFDALGTESSTFKVVSDTAEDGVPEYKYNSVKFNETLEDIDLGLVSLTSIKEVNNGISKKAPRKKKDGKQKAPETSEESQR